MVYGVEFKSEIQTIDWAHTKASVMKLLGSNKSVS